MHASDRLVGGVEFGRVEDVQRVNTSLHASSASGVSCNADEPRHLSADYSAKVLLVMLQSQL